MTDERERERDAGGKYVGTVSLDRVRAAVRDGGQVVTASEVADAVGCSRDAALEKLHTLADRDEVARKTVGARAIVWWIADADDQDTDSTQAAEDTLSAAEAVAALRGSAERTEAVDVER